MEKLTQFFTPHNYQLKLHVNKLTRKVYGTVVISGRQLAEQIKLHAVHLKLTRAKLNQAVISFRTESDTLIFSSPATQGQDIQLEIEYSFMLNQQMEGAYLSSYQFDGQTEWIVATQFESHYARQVFPCIDEPAAKATFDLKITSTDSTDLIIANTPAKVEKIITYDTVDEQLNLTKTATKKVVTFHTTPKMSTYLLAFCIGKFHSRSVTNQHGVKVTSYCALNQPPASLDFANQIAAKVLDFYNDLFGIKYPLPQLSQVALPDFEAGAMENWGLVTYRESCLLVGAQASRDTQEFVALIVAHELCHQWFGNLVTMAWWDDLWLNESFATMIEYLAVDAICPEYQIWQNFFTGECLAALRRDAQAGVQAVKQDVSSPEEIATLFDGAIVYAKGARLMLMLMRLMGQEQFFAGIKTYFQQHQYSNTKEDDLWQALQPHADFDVKAFMTAWISQPGYPVIKGDHQQRFLLSGATDQTKWPIPAIKDDMSEHLIIELTDAEFQAKIAQFQTLSLEQRLRLLIDRQLLARAGAVPVVSLLDLLPAFATETSYPLWQVIVSIINELKLFAPPKTPTHTHFQRYLAQPIQPQLQRLGFTTIKGEPVSDTKLRGIILALALYAEDQTAIATLAAASTSDYTTLDPELRPVILLASLLGSHEANLPQLLADYQATADPELKSELLDTITRAKQPEHLPALLALLDRPEVVRPQDHPRLTSYLIANFYTRTAAYEWLYGHWDYIRHIAGEKSLEDYVKIAASRITSQPAAQQFSHFFAAHQSDPALARSIAIANTEIASRLNWLDANLAAVQTKLAQLAQTAQA